MAQVLSPGALPEPEYQPEAPAEWEQNLSVKLMCPECREDPPNLVEDTSAGDVICESCGIVLSQRGIDQRAEWRTFANDDQGNDDPSRVGDAPNPLLHGNQLQTNIAFGDGSMRSKELHRAQSKATADKGNKNLLQAFKQIGAYCDGSKIPSMVADTAKHMFKDADESKVFKGKSNEAVIASCIFLACRRHDFPRSFREVYDMTKVTKKEIGRTFKLLEKVLKDAADKKAGKTSAAGNGVYVQHEVYKASSTTNPKELCARFCTTLDLDHRTSRAAEDIASQTAAIGILLGRSPLSIAAACIYMASHMMGHPRTPKQIGEAVKVSDSTIRNAYKPIYAEKEKVIPPEWLEKGAKFDLLPKPS